MEIVTHGIAQTSLLKVGVDQPVVAVWVVTTSSSVSLRTQRVWLTIEVATTVGPEVPHSEAHVVAEIKAELSTRLKTVIGTVVVVAIGRSATIWIDAFLPIRELRKFG